MLRLLSEIFFYFKEQQIEPLHLTEVEILGGLADYAALILKGGSNTHYPRNLYCSGIPLLKDYVRNSSPT